MVNKTLKRIRGERQKVRNEINKVKSEKQRLQSERDRLLSVRRERLPPRRLGVSKAERQRQVDRIESNRQARENRIREIESRTKRLDQAANELQKLDDELGQAEDRSKLTRKTGGTVVRDEEGQIIARFERGKEEGVLLDASGKPIGTTTRQQLGIERDRPPTAVGTGARGGFLFPDTSGFGGSSELFGQTTPEGQQFSPEQQFSQQPQAQIGEEPLTRRERARERIASFASDQDFPIFTPVISAVGDGLGVIESGVQFGAGKLGLLESRPDRSIVLAKTSEFLTRPRFSRQAVSREIVTGVLFGSSLVNRPLTPQIPKGTFKSGVITTIKPVGKGRIATESLVLTEQTGGLLGKKTFVTGVTGVSKARGGQFISLEVGQTQRVILGRALGRKVTTKTGAGGFQDRISPRVTTQREVIISETQGRQQFPSIRRGFTAGVKTPEGVTTFGATEQVLINPKGQIVRQFQGRGGFVGFAFKEKLVTPQTTSQLSKTGTSKILNFDTIALQQQQAAVLSAENQIIARGSAESIAKQTVTRPSIFATSLRQQQPQLLKTSQLQTQQTKQFQTPRVALATRTIGRQRPLTIARQLPTTRTAQAPRFAFATPQATRSLTKLLPAVRTTPNFPRTPAPKTPVRPIPFFPSFPIPKLRFGDLRAGDSVGKQRFKTVPSFSAFVFDTRGKKKGRGISGLRFQPLFRGFTFSFGRIKI